MAHLRIAASGSFPEAVNNAPRRYGGKVYAVGAQTLYVSSNDGLSWDALALPAPALSGAIYADVAVNGNDIVVIQDTIATANQKAAYIAYSTNGGASWTQAQVGTAVSFAPRNIVFGNGRFVALGTNGFSMTATSAAGAWSTNELAGSPVTGSVYELVAGNGFFLAGNNGQPIIRTTDGLNWSATSAYGRVSGNSSYVFSNDYAAEYSADGITWGELSSSNNSNAFAVSWGDGPFVLITGDTYGQLMAIAAPPPNPAGKAVIGSRYRTMIWVSATKLLCFDFDDWTRYDIVEFSTQDQWVTRNLPNGNGPSYPSKVVAAPNGTVVVAIDDDDGTYSAVSRDWGETWSYGGRVAMGLYYPAVLTYSKGKFIALYFNHGNSYTSVDGISWATNALPRSGQWVSALVLANGDVVVTDGTASSKSIVSSDGGATWQDFGNAFAAGGGGIAAAGNRIGIVGWSDGTVFNVSSDGGASWASHTIPFYATMLKSVSGQFVAFGGVGVTAVSETGASWVQSALPYSTNPYTATTEGGRIQVLPSLGDWVQQSYDGVSWLAGEFLPYGFPIEWSCSIGSKTFAVPYVDADGDAINPPVVFMNSGDPTLGFWTGFVYSEET